MKHPENMQAIAALHPDYMGFIFWERSARFFKGEIPVLPKGIKKAGVFVDASVDEVVSKVKQHSLDAVQLHGAESASYCQELRGNDNMSGKEIFKVFSIKDSFDFSVLKTFEPFCDYFLFDTKGKLPGGNGYTFDWEVLKNYPSEKPFLLSGGIGLDEIEKVKEILKTDLPIHAIDVNSKFEIEPGLKDEQNIEKFITQLR